MNSRDGADERNDLDSPGVTSQGHDSGPAILKQDQRESTAMNDAAAVQRRETAATAREDGVELRENAVAVREGAAATREREIQTAETMQAASDDHMAMLQQANARLTVATIEAQKLTEQVELSKAQMERAKSAAEKANLAKSDFLSSMSHELRTPLSAILGFAQLLEAGSPPPTAVQNERLQHITKAGWYLLDLINEILELAVIESGKLSLSLEPVPLSDVLLECQAMIEPQAHQHGIRINFHPLETTCIAKADRTRVKQALINLLSNAIKYNRAHGTVEVTCTATPERVRIGIKDSGAGLPPEKLAQLFQPFNRLGQETGTEEGTGIGLVVTRQLVELMGGSIGVESNVGVGSEFWIELIREVTPQLAPEPTMGAGLGLQAPAAAAREDLADLRKDAARLREGAAQVREEEAREREGDVASRKQEIRAAKFARRNSRGRDASGE